MFLNEKSTLCDWFFGHLYETIQTYIHTWCCLFCNCLCNLNLVYKHYFKHYALFQRQSCYFITLNKPALVIFCSSYDQNLFPPLTEIMPFLNLNVDNIQVQNSNLVFQLF